MPTKESHKSPEAAKKRAKLDARILAFLKDREPVSKSTIAAKLSTDSTAVKAALARLIKAGSITARGVTMNTTYALPDTKN